MSKEEKDWQCANMISKYTGNPVITSFFCRFTGLRHNHQIKNSMRKYQSLSREILHLSNREIFTQVFKYFLGEDIIFLNMDAIYADSEIYFSSVIDSLRNNTYVSYPREYNKKENEYCFHSETNKNRQSIFIFGNSDCMVHFDVWVNLMLVKKELIGLTFYLGSSGSKIYIDPKWGLFHCAALTPLVF